MTGQGGWPLNVFLDPGAGAVLRRHLLPAREPRTGMPSWRQVLEAVAEAWDTRRDEIASAAARRPSRAARGGGAARPPSGEPLSPRRRSTRPSRRSRASSTRVNGGFGGAPKFPPASALEFLPRSRGDDREMVACDDAARDGHGRHLRPGRRRLRALLASTPTGWCRTSRRCSTTTRCSRAPTCTAGRLTGDERFRGASATETLDWALREMRGAGGRLLLGARRRLRGRGGQVLRLDRRPSCARCSATTPSRRSRTSAPRRRAELRGRATSCTSRGADPTRAARAIRARALRGAVAARLAGPRRQAADRLERADDRGARRRGRGARPRATTSRPRATARDFVLDAAARRATAGCCAPSRTAARRLNAYLEDHAFLRRGAARRSTRRRSRRAGSPRRARSPTR